MQFESAAKPLYFMARIWFGAIMIYNGRYIFTYGTDTFWHNFFKNELHFPFPDLMFYLSKGSEFLGGLFLIIGIIPIIASSLLAFTMLIATFSANLHHLYGGFGTITISYSLFAILFMLKKQFENPKLRLLAIHSCIRLWFGSILVYNAMRYFLPGSEATLLVSIAELSSGLLIMIGLFSRVLSGLVAIFSFIEIIVFSLHGGDWNGYDFLVKVILFWFGCFGSIIHSTEIL